ncbi:MAG: hypothetical protein OXF66_05225 [Gammaproteobacteria bacterium]|nr:hypothetical protein [Gammaproteobacteria bacterium]
MDKMRMTDTDYVRRELYQKRAAVQSAVRADMEVEARAADGKIAG